MKIKRKVEMNLPELIEWLLKSKHHNYIANSDMGNTVRLSRYGAIQFSNGTFFPEETFTVEIEEEITEDTVFSELVELYKDTLSSNDGDNEILINENISIRRAKDEDECPSRAFYIMNDDMTMTLIWRDGKLI